MADFHYILHFIILTSLHAWVLLLTALFNLVRATKSNENATLAKISFLIAGSYLLTIPVMSYAEAAEWLQATEGVQRVAIYIIFFVLDILTILLLLGLFRSRVNKCSEVARLYSIAFLAFNSVLYLIVLNEELISNYQQVPYRAWVYWLYTIGLNTADWLLVVVLLIPKDFLGFYAMIKERRWPLVKTDTPSSS